MRPTLCQLSHFLRASCLGSYFPRNAVFSDSLCLLQVLLCCPLTLTGGLMRDMCHYPQSGPSNERRKWGPHCLATRTWTVNNLRGVCRQQRQKSWDVGLCSCFKIAGLKKCPWILRASWLTSHAGISDTLPEQSQRHL